MAKSEFNVNVLTESILVIFINNEFFHIILRQFI